MADIKNIDVFQTVTSVSFEVEPNTDIININKVTTSGYSGVPNLQEVTTIGNTTNNTIIANVASSNPANPAITGYSATGAGVYGQSDGKGVFGYSFLDTAVYGLAESVNGIGVKGYAEDGVGGEFETDAFDANIANFKKSGVLKAFINNAGELTAQKLKKDGGTSSEILAADGTVITAGTNITISGGTISSTGGGGGAPQTGQIIVTSGTSFTVPTGVGITTSTVFNIELVGGGGGGGGVPTAGSSGSGGGGGGYVFVRLTGLSPGNYTCVIGTGGGASAWGGNTTITILGVTYTASGGGAGANAISSNGGAGGTGTNGDINITGQSGDDSPTSSSAVQSSQGGSSAKGWGLGANGVRNTIAGKAATGYGGGGSAGKQNSTGGSGTGGIIFAQWFNQ